MNILALIAAIIMVESGGNTYAVGDNGRAFGSMQIHQCVIDDVNRVYNTHYVHEDAFNEHKARDMFIKYIHMYATHRRLGREPTYEDMARIWNGGPNGYRKESTIKYWEKVKERL